MDKRQEKLTDRCLTLLRDPRFWVFVVWTVFLISLVPLLYLSQYSHSCADDYSYGLLTHLAWEESHSLFAVLQAALAQIRQSYMTWQGTFSAIFLFTLQPAIFGEQYYWICPCILTAALVFSTLYLFRSVFGKLLKEKVLGDLYAGTLLLIQFQLMPSIVQGLFWWNGASYYVLFYCLLLVQLGNLIRLLFGSFSWLRVALCCLLGLLLGGGNYVTALLTLEMCLLFLLLGFLFHKARGGISLISAVTLASFLVNALAPGNAIRQSALVQNTVPGAILSAYQHAALKCLEWGRAPLLLLGMSFMVPFLWRLCREKLPKGLKPLPAAALLLLLFSAFASSFAPMEYAMMNSAIPGRVYNICYFLWTILLFLAAGTVMAAIQHFLPQQGAVEPLLRRGTPVFLAAVVLCTAYFGWYYWRQVWERNYPSTAAAIFSILDGSAAQYDAEADARIALFQTAEGSVVVPPHSRWHPLLCFSDISEDPEEWQNVAVARFYGLDQVTLGPSS